MGEFSMYLYRFSTTSTDKTYLKAASQKARARGGGGSCPSIERVEGSTVLRKGVLRAALWVTAIMRPLRLRRLGDEWESDNEGFGKRLLY